MFLDPSGPRAREAATIRSLTLVLALVATAGCANMTTQQHQMLSGGAIGAASGAAIGVIVGEAP